MLMVDEMSVFSEN